MRGVGDCVDFWIVLYDYLLKVMMLSGLVKCSNIEDTFFFHKLGRQSQRGMINFV